MALERNLSIIFKKVPTGTPVAGEHLSVEDRGYDSSASAPSGGVITNNLYASFDPYLRGRMREPEKRSYYPPFTLNEPITSYCVSRVLRSDNPDYRDGDLLAGPQILVQQYSSVPKETLENARKIDPSTALKDWRNFIGPLGMPGLTAYSSLYEIGKPKEGEIVGQLSKHEGLTVIGSIGSDEKLNFLTSDLGFDSGSNYKKEKPLDALKRLAPDGIDIYYENVGGEHLEAALETLRNNGRIVGCVMVSQYNTPQDQRYGIKNLFNMISKNLTFRGFIVGSPEMGPKYAKEHQQKLSQWLADGSFTARFSETEGIENGPQGFVGMLKGENFGKAVLKI